MRAERIDEVEALAVILRFDQFSHHVAEDGLWKAKSVERFDEDVDLVAEPGFKSLVELVGQDAARRHHTVRARDDEDLRPVVTRAGGAAAGEQQQTQMSAIDGKSAGS